MSEVFKSPDRTGEKPRIIKPENSELYSPIASIIYRILRKIYRASGLKSLLKSSSFRMPLDLNHPFVWDFLYSIKERGLKFESEKAENAREILSILAGYIADNDRIVELGCGNGYMLDLIRTHFPQCNAKGIDYSRKALELASHRGLYVRRQKIEDIDEVVEWFVSSHVFEHIRNPYNCIYMLPSLAKKGVLIQVPKPQHNAGPFHISCIKPEEMADLGFTNIDFGSMNNNFLLLKSQ